MHILRYYIYRTFEGYLYILCCCPFHVIVANTFCCVCVFFWMALYSLCCSLKVLVPLWVCMLPGMGLNCMYVEYAYTYVYIHICIYVYICIYIHVHTYIHTYIYYYYELYGCYSFESVSPFMVFYAVKSGTELYVYRGSYSFKALVLLWLCMLWKVELSCMHIEYVYTYVFYKCI